MKSIQVGADGWSARLPLGWHVADPSKPNHLQSADGSAGAYFLQVALAEQDLAGAVRRVHQVGVESLPHGSDGWQVLREQESTAGDRIDLVGEFYNSEHLYLLCSRVIGRGRLVVRMTFHDYYCEGPSKSVHTPLAWLNSLQLAPRQGK